MSTPAFAPPEVRDVPPNKTVITVMVKGRRFTIIADGTSENGELVELCLKQNATEVQDVTRQETSDIALYMEPSISEQNLWEYKPPIDDI